MSNDTETLTLTSWLLARIAEDEAVARAANGPRWASGEGDVSEGGLYALEGGDESGWAIALFQLGMVNEGADGARLFPGWPKMQRRAHQNSIHAARHDPARVLAECEAKRRIVELHSKILEAYPDPKAYCCAECSAGGEYPGGGWPCATLCALAQTYQDHPDYRDEWRPSFTGSTRPAR